MYPYPSPLRWSGSEATSTQTWHYSCSVTLLFFKKIYNYFLLVNLFCLVIYFHTNELVNKTLSWSTFETTGIHDEVFKASLLDFWDRNISRRTAESRRYVFRRVTMSPFDWLWKIFNISSSAGNRSPFFFRWNRLLYLLCRPLKLSQETRCTILMYLGQEAFNFRFLCEQRCKAIKLKLVDSCSDSFDWEKGSSFFCCLQRNYFLKKFVKTWDSAAMIKIFSTTVALFTNVSRKKKILFLKLNEILSKWTRMI